MDTTDSQYVTLVSNDGFEFILKRSAAIISKFIARALDTSRGQAFGEAQAGRCEFDSLNGIVLEKVCEYLYYNEKNRDRTDVKDLELPTELLLELIMAADFLEC